MTGDEIPAEAVRGAQKAYRGALVRGRARTRAEVTRFLAGLDIVAPGVVNVAEWRPGLRAPVLDSPALLWAGIGRKPGASR